MLSYTILYNRGLPEGLLSGIPGDVGDVLLGMSGCTYIYIYREREIYAYTYIRHAIIMISSSLITVCM